MKTKLTLSVDEDLVQFARNQARANKKSISGMFSEFLLHHKTLARKTSTPTIASMRGSLKNYTINDSKKAVQNAYAQKYSR